jgi:hypothetical protein
MSRKYITVDKSKLGVTTLSYESEAQIKTPPYGGVIQEQREEEDS